MRIYTYFALFCVSLILASCSDNEDNNISSPTEEVYLEQIIMYL